MLQLAQRRVGRFSSPVLLLPPNSHPSASCLRSQQMSSEHLKHEDLEQQASPFRPSWRTFWCEEISSRSLIPPLLVVTAVCGLLDATTYTDYHTFASNQTGNSIVLTCLAVGLPTQSSLRLTLSSLFAFLIAAFLGGVAARVLGARKRFWLAISLSLQLVLFIIPSALASSGALSVRGPHDWVLIGMLAAGSGFQVAMARGSSNPELPSAMLTSPFVDLLTDPYLFVAFKHPHSRARNLRVLYIFTLLGGSFLGAGLIKAKSTELVWWIVVGIRSVILTWVVSLKGEKPDEGARKDCHGEREEGV